MDKLEKAFENFSKYIKELTPEEIEERINKLDDSKYAGVTMEELCSSHSSCFSFHAEISNKGWFDAGSPYFKKISSFFIDQ